MYIYNIYIYIYIYIYTDRQIDRYRCIDRYIDIYIYIFKNVFTPGKKIKIKK